MKQTVAGSKEVTKQTTGSKSYTQEHEFGETGRDNGVGGNSKEGPRNEKHGQRKARQIAQGGAGDLTKGK